MVPSCNPTQQYPSQDKKRAYLKTAWYSQILILEWVTNESLWMTKYKLELVGIRSIEHELSMYPYSKETKI